MRKTLLLFCFIVFSNIAIAQDKSIIGSWQVKEVVSPKDNPVFQDLVKGLSKSTFIFNNDNSFKITSTNPTESLKYITYIADNGFWKLENQTIVISDKSDKSLLTKIFISKKDDKTFFTFFETNLVLEVKKAG